ncbi:hypothetical protein [Pantanalinema sp. GBBB05]|uniref:hypothetical protein n=1 Tax=Pantanalinema sp. GBBB05 TaxID=2604139 RepID=UPI001D352AA2|nr:hypothetical protein [Pantanalinema sp. GBBB05]
MNYKRLIFAGGVTMAIGIALGIILVVLLPSRYSGGFYQKRQPIFITVGAALGLLVGTSQEAIRQLQQNQDQQ